ncbi:histidine phosphatase family protein [Streptomyces sp. RB6PN25]|uniref:Histidine phosphatase family protein n=1 Tax=Streptomyces humicola TaxID=2953240 RepID=A0ABT1PQY3_9ACTN|nr:histidine phosphatase family protein [Streptomyces humicola]MCQ4080083.1 histidine phosphatase family protein [Streptomyces humicola]
MNAREDRHLIVVRHAKSAWPPDVADRERPLGPRGLRDAPAVGRWLRDNGFKPDRVVCSPAHRTRATWELVAHELDTADPPVAYDGRIYGADTDGLLDVVHDVPTPTRTLLLLGHAPGVQELTLELAAEGERDALERVQEKFPTSAVAVLTTPAAWPDLAPGSARLAAFVVPRGRKH